jgi:hypothetical protein
MGVVNPESVQDHIDRLQTFADFKEIAVGKGLDDAKFESFLTDEQSGSKAAIAAALKVPGPDGLPRVAQAADGVLYAAKLDGSGDGFAVLNPTPAASIALDGSSTPGPTLTPSPTPTPGPSPTPTPTPSPTPAPGPTPSPAPAPSPAPSPEPAPAPAPSGDASAIPTPLPSDSSSGGVSPTPSGADGTNPAPEPAPSPTPMVNAAGQPIA